jgi:hypothetical protein
MQSGILKSGMYLVLSFPWSVWCFYCFPLEIRFFVILLFSYHDDTKKIKSQKIYIKMFFSGQLLDGPRNEKRIIVDESPMQLSVYTVSLKAFEAFEDKLT